jgi:hypothetical protein
VPASVGDIDNKKKVKSNNIQAQQVCEGNHHLSLLFYNNNECIQPHCSLAPHTPLQTTMQYTDNTFTGIAACTSAMWWLYSSHALSKCFHGMIMRILGIFTFARRIASHLKQSQPRLELISYRSLTTTSLNLCQGTHFNFMYNLTWTWHLGKIPHILQRWYCGLLTLIFTYLYITKLTCNCVSFSSCYGLHEF